MVDNLWIAKKLMWGMRYATLDGVFYTPFTQAIIIHIKFFKRNKKKKI